MDNNALVPDAPILTEIPDLTSDTADELSEQHDKVVEQDKDKAEVMVSKGWDQIVTILDRHIDDFRTGRKIAITADTPLADIGQKFVVASEIARICEEIKADVVNAANGVLDGTGNK